MLTHGASVKAYDTWSTVVGLRAGDRYLIVNPFFHAFGLKAGILASLIKGATIVPHAVFDVEAVMQRVAEEHISMLPGPPTIYQSILDHPHIRDFDMSSLRLAIIHAASGRKSANSSGTAWGRRASTSACSRRAASNVRATSSARRASWCAAAASASSRKSVRRCA